jgi:O-6-methylguanine DNA methyltransferase
MRCNVVVKRLDAFRTGELEQRERQDVAEHMAGCRSCADELTTVERLAAGLSSLRAPAPPRILEEVLDRVDARYGKLETAIGSFWVGFSSRGISLIRPATESATAFERTYVRRLGSRPRPAEVPTPYVEAIHSAAAGHDSEAPAVDLSAVDGFDQEVLQKLREIPRGEVRSYAWLARETGRPRAVRAVGNALAKNPVPLIFPCHRVVPASGGVGGYALGSRLKRAVLEREGVPVDDLERLTRSGVRYIGYTETGTYCFPTCGGFQDASAEGHVPLIDERHAAQAGFKPCSICRPLAIAA